MEIVEKILPKQSGGAEVVNVIRVKMQVFNVVNDLVQTCTDGISCIVGVSPEKCVKYHRFIGIFFFKIALHHGQLVQVRQKGQVSFAHGVSSQCNV